MKFSMTTEIKDESYYYELAKRSVPEVLSTNPSYDILLKVLGWALSRDHKLISSLDSAYNADTADEELLTKLADTLSIDYPLTYDSGRLRLLLKYYNKIRRNRGSLDSIKQIIRIIESTEEEIALNENDKHSDLKVIQIRPGSIIIKYDGITDFEFTREMLKKVRPVGYEINLAHIEGPVKYDFDLGSGSEEGHITAYHASSDRNTVSESANVVKGLRTESARFRETMRLVVDKVGKSGSDEVVASDTFLIDKS
ncbi:tail protein I [Listeria phage LIS04]|nr:tail protein I [Listeria phage LIS04]